MMFWIVAALLAALSVSLLWTGLKHAPRMAVIVMLVIPAFSAGLYWTWGSPDMPDFPASQQTWRPDRIDEAQLLQERPLIRQLRQDPGNETLWLKLITLYVDTNRLALAREAHRDALTSVAKPQHLRDPALRKLLAP